LPSVSDNVHPVAKHHQENEQKEGSMLMLACSEVSKAEKA